MEISLFPKYFLLLYHEKQKSATMKGKFWNKRIDFSFLFTNNCKFRFIELLAAF